MSLEYDPDYERGRLSAYAEQVYAMRYMQKQYFKHRSPDDLRKAREMEARVDRATDAILNPPEPTLFDGEG